MRKFTLSVLGAAMALGMYAQEAQEVPDMYIIGSAVGSGQWDTKNFLQMEYQGDNVYTWTGELKGKGTEGTNDNAADVGFRFTLGTDWWPGISPKNGAEANGYQICELGVEYIVAKHDAQPDPDARFQVAETGTYSVSINLEGLRLLIVEGTEPIYPTIPTLGTDSLYLVGGAVNATGEWDHSLPPIELVGENGVFTFNDTLYTNAKDSAEFKFKTLANSWDETLVSAMEGGQAIAAVEGEDAAAVEYDMVFRPFEGSPNDFPFLITATGVYDLTIDLNTKKLTVNSFTPVEEEGNNAVAMVSEDVVRVLAAANTITLSAQGDNVITSASVYDVAGKCLGTVSESGSQVWFEGLSNGLYIVKMNCAGKDYVQKVLVK